jgi:hypothetical protein
MALWESYPATTVASRPETKYCVAFWFDASSIIFVQFVEMEGSDGKATVLIAPAVQGPLES